MLLWQSIPANNARRTFRGEPENKVAMLTVEASIRFRPHAFMHSCIHVFQSIALTLSQQNAETGEMLGEHNNQASCSIFTSRTAEDLIYGSRKFTYFISRSKLILGT